MSYSQTNVGLLTVLQTALTPFASNVITADEGFADAVTLAIFGPGNLNGSTYTLQGCDDPGIAAGGNATFAGSVGWLALKDETGAAIALPAINEARTYPLIRIASVYAIRIVANAAPGANTSFHVLKSFLALAGSYV